MAVIEEKYCRGCRRYLAIDFFMPPRGGRNLLARCQTCTREYYRDRRHLAGIEANYPKTETCAICHYGFDEEHKNSSAHFDHDHETLTFRGWICGRCNMALGHIDDNPEIAERMAVYLRQHQERLKTDHAALANIPQGLFDAMKKLKGD